MISLLPVFATAELPRIKSQGVPPAREQPADGAGAPSSPANSALLATDGLGWRPTDRNAVRLDETAHRPRLRTVCRSHGLHSRWLEPRLGAIDSSHPRLHRVHVRPPLLRQGFSPLSAHQDYAWIGEHAVVHLADPVCEPEVDRIVGHHDGGHCLLVGNPRQELDDDMSAFGIQS